MNTQIQSSKKKSCLHHRLTAAVVCACYVLTQQTSQPLWAAVPTEISSQAPMAVLPDTLSALKIPAELGRVEETFDGKTKPIVFLIQDAHAVTDAQKNIQKLIAHFRATYGINQVAVEGAAAPLDATLFKTFPDAQRLKRVFKDYLDRGELTGPTAAAVFNRQTADLEGAEDWTVFEDGLKFYLLAMDNLLQIETLLASREKELHSRKERLYSPALLDIDRAFKGFTDERLDLASLLKKLALVREPAQGSGPAVMLQEIRHETAGENGNSAAVRKIAEKIKSQITSSMSHGTSDMQKEFNQKYQEFQTGQIHEQAFALFLKEFLESQPSLQNRFTAPGLLNQLSNLSGHQKMLREIEGTKFFAELKDYAAQVKDGLFANEEARTLDRESDDLARLGRLVRLKIDHADWDQIQKTGLPAGDDKFQELLKPALAFYQNAKERDRILFGSVEKRLKKNVAEKSGRPACLLVAGGFHTQGVTQLLREKNISYAVLMPQIDKLPDEHVYSDQMRGQVSWGKYLKEENGSIDLHAAFVRATRDRLLANSVERQGDSHPASELTAAPYTLKRWRDQIIRDLSAQGRIAEAARYTRYLDEVTTEGDNVSEHEFIRLWRANVHRFVDGLQRLDSQKQLTPDNVARLLTPSVLPPAASANAGAARAVLRNFIRGADGRLLPKERVISADALPAVRQQTLRSAAVTAKSEMRGARRPRTSVGSAELRPEMRGARKPRTSADSPLPTQPVPIVLSDSSAKEPLQAGVSLKRTRNVIVNALISFLPVLALIGLSSFHLFPYQAAVAFFYVTLGSFAGVFLVRGFQKRGWKNFSRPGWDDLKNDLFTSIPVIAWHIPNMLHGFGQHLTQPYQEPGLQVSALTMLTAISGLTIFYAIRDRWRGILNKSTALPAGFSARGIQGLLLSVVGVDQIMKFLAIKFANPYFHAAPYAAGSMTAGVVAAQLFLAAIVLVSGHYSLPMGLVLLFAGVYSNLMDMYVWQGVVDFFPLLGSANLADLAIWIGAGFFMHFATQIPAQKDYRMSNLVRDLKREPQEMPAFSLKTMALLLLLTLPPHLLQDRYVLVLREAEDGRYQQEFLEVSRFDKTLTSENLEIIPGIVRDLAAYFAMRDRNGIEVPKKNDRSLPSSVQGMISQLLEEPYRSKAQEEIDRLNAVKRPFGTDDPFKFGAMFLYQALSLDAAKEGTDAFAGLPAVLPVESQQEGPQSAATAKSEMRQGGSLVAFVDPSASRLEMRAISLEMLGDLHRVLRSARDSELTSLLRFEETDADTDDAFLTEFALVTGYSQQTLAPHLKDLKSLAVIERVLRRLDRKGSFGRDFDGDKSVEVIDLQLQENYLFESDLMQARLERLLEQSQNNSDATIVSILHHKLERARGHYDFPWGEFSVGDDGRLLWRAYLLDPKNDDVLDRTRLPRNLEVITGGATSGLYDAQITEKISAPKVEREIYPGAVAARKLQQMRESITAGAVVNERNLVLEPGAIKTFFGILGRQIEILKNVDEAKIDVGKNYNRVGSKALRSYYEKLTVLYDPATGLRRSEMRQGGSLGTSVGSTVSRPEMRGTEMAKRWLERSVLKSLEEKDSGKQMLGIFSAFYAYAKTLNPAVAGADLLNGFKLIEQGVDLRRGGGGVSETSIFSQDLINILRKKYLSKQASFHQLAILENLAQLTLEQTGLIEAAYAAAQPANRLLRRLAALGAWLADFVLSGVEYFSRTAEKRTLQEKINLAAEESRKGAAAFKAVLKAREEEAHGTDSLANAFGILKSGSIVNSKGLDRGLAQTAPLSELGSSSEGPHDRGEGLFVYSLNPKTEVEFSAEGTPVVSRVKLENILLIIFSPEIAELMKQRFPQYAGKIKSYGEAADWFSQNPSARSEMRQGGRLGTSVDLPASITEGIQAAQYAGFEDFVKKTLEREEQAKAAGAPHTYIGRGSNFTVFYIPSTNGAPSQEYGLRVSNDMKATEISPALTLQNAGPNIDINVGQVLLEAKSSTGLVQIVRFQPGENVGGVTAYTRIYGAKDDPVWPVKREQARQQAIEDFAGYLSRAAQMPGEAFLALAADVKTILTHPDGLRVDPSKAGNLRMDVTGKKFGLVDLNDKAAMGYPAKEQPPINPSSDILSMLLDLKFLSNHPETLSDAYPDNLNNLRIIARQWLQATLDAGLPLELDAFYANNVIKDTLNYLQVGSVTIANESVPTAVELNRIDELAQAARKHGDLNSAPAQAKLGEAQAAVAQLYRAVLNSPELSGAARSEMRQDGSLGTSADSSVPRPKKRLVDASAKSAEAAENERILRLSQRLRSLAPLVAWLPHQEGDLSEATIQEFYKNELEPDYFALDRQTLEQQIRDSTFDSRENTLRFLARTSAWLFLVKDELEDKKLPQFNPLSGQITHLITRSLAGRNRDLKKSPAAILAEVFESVPAFKNNPLLQEMFREPLLKMISQYRENLRERFFTAWPAETARETKESLGLASLRLAQRLGSSDAGRFLFSSPLWGLFGLMLGGTVTMAIVFGVISRLFLRTFQGLVDNLGDRLDAVDENGKLKYQAFKGARTPIGPASNFEQVRRAFAESLAFALSPQEAQNPLLSLSLLEKRLRPADGLKDYRQFVRAVRLRFLDETLEGLTPVRMWQILNEEVQRAKFSRGDEKVIFLFQALGVSLTRPAVVTEPAKSFLSRLAAPFVFLGRSLRRIFRSLLRALVGSIFRPLRTPASMLQMKQAARFLLRAQNRILVALTLEPVGSTDAVVSPRTETQLNPFFNSEKQPAQKAELVLFLRNLKIPEMEALIKFVEDEVTIKFDDFIDKKWYPPFVVLPSREGRVKNMLDGTSAYKGQSAYDFENQTLRLGASMPKFMKALVLVKLVSLAFQHKVIRANTETIQLTDPALIRIQRKILWQLGKSILTRGEVSDPLVRQQRLVNTAYFLAAAQTVLFGDTYTYTASPGVAVVVRHNVFFRGAIKAKENFTKAFYFFFTPRLIGETDQPAYPQAASKTGKWLGIAAAAFGFIKPLAPAIVALAGGLLGASIFLAMFSGLMFNLNLDFLGDWVVGLKNLLATLDFLGIGPAVKGVWSWLEGSYAALRETLNGFLSLFGLDLSFLKTALTNTWQSLEPVRAAVRDYAVPFIYLFVMPALIFVWGLVYGVLIRQMRIKLRQFLSSEEGPPAIAGSVTKLTLFTPLFFLGQLTKPFFGSEWVDAGLRNAGKFAERLSAGSRVNAVLRRVFTRSFDGLYAAVSFAGTLGYGYFILALASPAIDLASRINALQSSGVAIPPMALFYASMIFVGLPFALLASVMDWIYRFLGKTRPGLSKRINMALVSSLFLILSVLAPLSNWFQSTNFFHLEFVYQSKLDYSNSRMRTIAVAVSPSYINGYKGHRGLGFETQAPWESESDREVVNAEPLHMPGAPQLVEAYAKTQLVIRYPGMERLVHPRTGLLNLPSAETLRKFTAGTEELSDQYGLNVLIGEDHQRELGPQDYGEFLTWLKSESETLINGIKDKKQAIYGNSGFFLDLFSLLDVQSSGAIDKVLSADDLALIQSHLLDILDGKVTPGKDAFDNFAYDRVALKAFVRLQEHAHLYYRGAIGESSNAARAGVTRDGFNRFMNLSKGQLGYDLGRIVSEAQEKFRKDGISERVFQSETGLDMVSTSTARAEMRQGGSLGTSVGSAVLRPEMRQDGSLGTSVGSAVLRPEMRQSVLSLFGVHPKETIRNLPRAARNLQKEPYLILVSVVHSKSESLGSVTADLKRTIDHLEAKLGGLANVVFIDDGSREKESKTLTALQNLNAEKIGALQFISFDRNQQRDVAVYAGLEFLGSHYGTGLPKYFISLDADSLLEPALGTASLGEGLKQAVQDMDRNTSAAMTLEIHGDVSRTWSPVEQLQALDWRINMAMSRFAAAMGLAPSIPGGAVMFDTSRFKRAIEQTVYERGEWKFATGPEMLRRYLIETAEQDHAETNLWVPARIAAPFQAVQVKTRVFPTLRGLIIQRMRWMEGTTETPRALKNLLNFAIAANLLAGSFFLVTDGLNFLAELFNFFSPSIAVLFLGSFLYALNEALRGLKHAEKTLASPARVLGHAAFMGAATPVALLVMGALSALLFLWQNIKSSAFRGGSARSVSVTAQKGISSAARSESRAARSELRKGGKDGIEMPEGTNPAVWAAIATPPLREDGKNPFVEAFADPKRNPLTREQNIYLVGRLIEHLKSAIRERWSDPKHPRYGQLKIAQELRNDFILPEVEDPLKTQAAFEKFLGNFFSPDIKALANFYEEVTGQKLNLPAGLPDKIKNLAIESIKSVSQKAFKAWLGGDYQGVVVADPDVRKNRKTGESQTVFVIRMVDIEQTRSRLYAALAWLTALAIAFVSLSFMSYIKHEIGALAAWGGRGALAAGLLAFFGNYYLGGWLKNWISKIGKALNIFSRLKKQTHLEAFRRFMTEETYSVYDSDGNIVRNWESDLKNYKEKMQEVRKAVVKQGGKDGPEIEAILLMVERLTLDAFKTTPWYPLAGKQGKRMITFIAEIHGLLQAGEEGHTQARTVALAMFYAVLSELANSSNVDRNFMKKWNPPLALMSIRNANVFRHFQRFFSQNGPALRADKFHAAQAKVNVAALEVNFNEPLQEYFTGELSSADFIKINVAHFDKSFIPFARNEIDPAAPRNVTHTHGAADAVLRASSGRLSALVLARAALEKRQEDIQGKTGLRTAFLQKILARLLAIVKALITRTENSLRRDAGLNQALAQERLAIWLGAFYINQARIKDLLEKAAARIGGLASRAYIVWTLHRQIQWKLALDQLRREKSDAELAQMGLTRKELDRLILHVHANAYKLIRAHVHWALEKKLDKAEGEDAAARRTLVKDLIRHFEGRLLPEGTTQLNLTPENYAKVGDYLLNHEKVGELAASYKALREKGQAPAAEALVNKQIEALLDTDAHKQAVAAQYTADLKKAASRLESVATQVLELGTADKPLEASFEEKIRSTVNFLNTGTLTAKRLANAVGRLGDDFNDAYPMQAVTSELARAEKIRGAKKKDAQERNQRIHSIRTELTSLDKVAEALKTREVAGTAARSEMRGQAPLRRLQPEEPSRGIRLQGRLRETTLPALREEIEYNLGNFLKLALSRGERFAKVNILIDGIKQNLPAGIRTPQAITEQLARGIKEKYFGARKDKTHRLDLFVTITNGALTISMNLVSRSKPPPFANRVLPAFAERPPPLPSVQRQILPKVLVGTAIGVSVIGMLIGLLLLLPPKADRSQATPPVSAVQEGAPAKTELSPKVESPAKAALDEFFSTGWSQFLLDLANEGPDSALTKISAERMIEDAGQISTEVVKLADTFAGLRWRLADKAARDELEKAVTEFNLKTAIPAGYYVALNFSEAKKGHFYAVSYVETVHRHQTLTIQGREVSLVITGEQVDILSVGRPLGHAVPGGIRVNEQLLAEMARELTVAARSGNLTEIFPKKIHSPQLLEWVQKSFGPQMDQVELTESFTRAATVHEIAHKIIEHGNFSTRVVADLGMDTRGLPPEDLKLITSETAAYLAQIYFSGTPADWQLILNNAAQGSFSGTGVSTRGLLNLLAKAAGRRNLRDDEIAVFVLKLSGDGEFTKKTVGVVLNQYFPGLRTELEKVQSQLRSEMRATLNVGQTIEFVLPAGNESFGMSVTREGRPPVQMMRILGKIFNYEQGAIDAPLSADHLILNTEKNVDGIRLLYKKEGDQEILVIKNTQEAGAVPAEVDTQGTQLQIQKTLEAGQKTVWHPPAGKNVASLGIAREDSSLLTIQRGENGEFSYVDIKKDDVIWDKLPIKKDGLIIGDIRLFVIGEVLYIKNMGKQPAQLQGDGELLPAEKIGRARPAAPAAPEVLPEPGSRVEQISGLQPLNRISDEGADDVIRAAGFSSSRDPFAQFGEQLTLPALVQNGFAPAYLVESPIPELPDRSQKVYLADKVVDIGDGRAFTIGYVENINPKTGKLYPNEPAIIVRTYYRSNSNGGFWRLLPGVSIGEEGTPSWYDKAFSEDSITIETNLLQTIDAVARLRGISSIADEKLRYRLFAGTARRSTLLARLERYEQKKANRDGDSLVRAFGLDGRALDDGSEVYRNEGKLRPPADVGFRDSRTEPLLAVSQIKNEFKLMSSIYTDGLPDEIRITEGQGEPSIETLETQRGDDLPGKKWVEFNSGTKLTYFGTGVVKRLEVMTRGDLVVRYRYENANSSQPLGAAILYGGINKGSVELEVQPDGRFLLNLPDGSQQFFNDMGRLIQEVRGTKTYDFNYGLVTVREFDSQEFEIRDEETGKTRLSQLRYAFVQDKLGRVMIGGIWDLHAPRNAFGLRYDWIDGGSKTTPIYEYVGRQAGDYGDYADRNGRYMGMWKNYLSQVPIIQEYIEVMKAAGKWKEDPDAPLGVPKPSRSAREEWFGAPPDERFIPGLAQPTPPLGIPVYTDPPATTVGENSVFYKWVTVPESSAANWEFNVDIDSKGNITILTPRAKIKKITIPVAKLAEHPVAVTFGRDPNSDILFGGDSTSRKHGEIHFTLVGNRLTVQLEVKGRHGIYLDGIKKEIGSHPFADVTIKRQPLSAQQAFDEIIAKTTQRLLADARRAGRDSLNPDEDWNNFETRRQAFYEIFVGLFNEEIAESIGVFAGALTMPDERYGALQGKSDEYLGGLYEVLLKQLKKDESEKARGKDFAALGDILLVPMGGKQLAYEVISAANPDEIKLLPLNRDFEVPSNIRQPQTLSLSELSFLLLMGGRVIRLTDTPLEGGRFNRENAEAVLKFMLAGYGPEAVRSLLAARLDRKSLTAHASVVDPAQVQAGSEFKAHLSQIGAGILLKRKDNLPAPYLKIMQDFLKEEERSVRDLPENDVRNLFPGDEIEIENRGLFRIISGAVDSDGQLYFRAIRHKDGIKTKIKAQDLGSAGRFKITAVSKLTRRDLNTGEYSARSEMRSSGIASINSQERQAALQQFLEADGYLSEGKIGEGAQGDVYGFSRVENGKRRRFALKVVSDSDAEMRKILRSQLGHEIRVDEALRVNLEVFRGRVPFNQRVFHFDPDANGVEVLHEGLAPEKTSFPGGGADAILMDFIPGVSIAEFLDTATPKRRQKYRRQFETAFVAVAKDLFASGYYLADNQPGNYRVSLKGGQLELRLVDRGLFMPVRRDKTPGLEAGAISMAQRNQMADIGQRILRGVTGRDPGKRTVVEIRKIFGLDVKPSETKRSRDSQLPARSESRAARAELRQTQSSLPVRAEMRLTEAVKPTAVESAALVQKAALALAPRIPGEYVVSLRLSKAEVQALVVKYEGDPKGLESELLSKIDIIERKAFEVMIQNLDQSTKDIQRSYAVGIVIPAGLEDGVWLAFMEGYIEALKGSVSEVLVNGVNSGEFIQGLSQAGLSGRTGLNPNRPKPVLRGDEQEGIPVAALGAQTGAMHQDFISFGVDLTAKSLEPFKNDREMLKLIGRTAARAQVILADLSNGAKLAPAELKAELLKRLFAEQITKESLIEMIPQGSTTAFKMNLGVMAEIVNQIMTREASKSSA